VTARARQSSDAPNAEPPVAPPAGRREAGRTGPAPRQERPAGPADSAAPEGPPSPAQGRGAAPGPRAPALHSILLVSDRHLLIVDESQKDAAALAKALAREGYLTRHVADADQALRQVGGKRTPDLVFMACAAAGRAFEALKALKARVEPSFLPVIALFPRVSREMRVTGLRAGADDVLAKPWDVEEVLARVAALLRIKSCQDALEEKRLELERQSVTDPLTGLFNRRYFQYRLHQEVARGQRYGEPVSLLVADLDHFKHVNDRYGHATGDQVLRTTAGLLSAEVRRPDVCTRFGGEEFAVIMPNTGAAGAQVVARRILKALRERASLSAPPIHRRDARPEAIRITASFGLASYPGAGVAGAEELFRRADAAMYRAKAEGRNRVCLAGEHEDAPVRPEEFGDVLHLVPVLPRLAAVQ